MTKEFLCECVFDLYHVEKVDNRRCGCGLFHNDTLVSENLFCNSCHNHGGMKWISSRYVYIDNVRRYCVLSRPYTQQETKKQLDFKEFDKKRRLPMDQKRFPLAHKLGYEYPFSRENYCPNCLLEHDQNPSIKLYDNDHLEDVVFATYQIDRNQMIQELKELSVESARIRRRRDHPRNRAMEEEMSHYLDHTKSPLDNCMYCFRDLVFKKEQDANKRI